MSPVMKLCFVLLFNGLACLLFANAIHSATLDPPIPCTNDTECGKLFPTVTNATCRNGFCLCENGTETKNCSSAAVAPTGIRTAAAIHRPCKQPQDCNFHGGTCNTTINQCTCQTNYVLSSDKQACLQKALDIGFPCTDDNQCQFLSDNAICQAHQCVCIDGYHYTDKSCYRKIGFGENCTKSQECSHVDGGVCLDSKVCGCPAETIINMDGKRCLAVAREILQECTESIQCSTSFLDAACVDKKCKCKEGYHYQPEMSRCFINRALDENCGNNYECFQADNQNVTGPALQCLSNTCTCAENYYREDNQCVNAASQIMESTLWISIVFVLARSSFFS